ncbi:hypothetical protein GCK72_013698 [Caenorhabditis remanei]|uniref:HORMA domain-containing protein n=1 Tax=Caenorhabditis remanei TaxID=31234 RepID=A0A6A5GRP1_CAERE|nr:hypothetical protein GCK72_013698 [Caenorhabditis remanei]KAF1757243.1 hypothetical protein GCK72_013698 [Caenorhabditis remanei]
MAPLEAAYNESINKSLDVVTDSKWVKMFPQCVADADKSSNFMTRALYVGFSAILSKRGVLGPEFFSKNHITEKLKCMSLCFKNPKALQISQLLKNAGDAIKKGYLKEISLVITENEGDVDAIEVYSFKFHYFKNGGVAAQLSTKVKTDEPSPFEKLTELDYQGTETVRNQLVMMTRSISHICEKVLEPLPNEFDANFRIDYTDEAPLNYRIEGFFDSSTFYTLPNDIQSATLGHLRPGYHASLLDVSSIFIPDTYAAELSLKRHAEKTAEKLGYTADGILYKSFSFDGNASNTTSDANSLASSTTLTPTVVKKNGKKSDHSSSARVAPYSKGRSRK